MTFAVHSTSRHFKRAAVALALAGASFGAAAQSFLEGTTFYIGGAYIDVNSKAPPLESNPATLPAGVHAGLRVGDASTVGLGFVTPITGPYTFELALGIPPTHSVYGTDFITPFGQISTVKQIAPTVFVNYHFDDGGLGMSPFIGVGVNYTKFTNRKSTPSGNAASGGATDIKLTDSIGLAAHVGLTYKLDKNWQISSTVAYADVRSDMTATTQTRGTSGLMTVVRTTSIDFRPVVYTLCIGYTF